MYSIEVAVPVLNEEKRLTRGIEELVNRLEATHLKFIITIADNGSTDKTPEVARLLTQKYINVQYIRVEGKGVGLALKKVWSESQMDIVGYTDVDMSTNLNHINDVIKAFSEGYDVVNSSRLLKTSKVINRTFKREIASLLFNFILKFRLKVKITDGMCGFKFLKKNAYLQIRNTDWTLSDKWFFNTEVICKAEFLNLKIKEIPVIWNDDSHSNVKIFPLAIEYLKEIERVRREKNLVLNNCQQSLKN